MLRVLTFAFNLAPSGELMSSKNRAKSQAARAKNKEYKARLKALQKVGAYEPKSDELTDYRKRQINKLWRSLGDKIAPDKNAQKKYFFVDTDKLTGPERKKFLANAKSLNIATTKRGIFLQKEGQRKARLAWNNENKEYDVLLTGKVKWGVNKGKTITDRIPIGNIDQIEKEFQRIRNVADQFGTLKKGQAISFIVQEQGEETGASLSTFQDSDALLKYIDARYHRDNKAARLKFLRMIRVRKTTIVKWGKEHPARPRKRAQKPKGYNPH